MQFRPVKKYTVTFALHISSSIQYNYVIQQQKFVGWLIDCPYVLVIILVSGGAIYFTYKLLKQFQTLTFLSSPKVSIILMLVLISVMMRSYSINNQLLTLQTDLDTANWGLIQGSQYRIDILNMIDTATMERKHRDYTEHTDNR